MFKVNIYIETTWRGPARKSGAAMWLVEYQTRNGIPVTRDGMAYLEDGTENQGVLMALTEAFGILTKPCSARVFTRCDHVLCAVGNCWHIQWQKNGWHNAKGKLVKNAGLWQELMTVMEPHACTWLNEDHTYRSVMEMDLRKEIEHHDRRIQGDPR